MRQADINVYSVNKANRSITVIDGTVRTLRAVQILAEQDMSVTELAGTLGVDRGTARRLLSTLVAEGYAKLITGNSKYSINPNRILKIASVLRERFPWPEVAIPFVRELRDLTQETSQVAVMLDDSMILVHQERSQATVAVTHLAKKRFPIHCSSVGKAYSAFLEDSELESLLSRIKITPLTPRSIVSNEELKLHLRRVRERGYAVDDEETELGMRCLAAPVFGPEDKVFASLGISGPSTRLSLGRIQELAPFIVAIANRLSVALGGCPGKVTSTP